MFLKLMKNNPLLTVGLTICSGWLLIAIVAPYISPYDPLAQNLAMRFRPPSALFWLGSDSLGRDVLSRILVGSRISILAGLMTISFAAFIGTIYGGLSGYIGGRLDDIKIGRAHV